MKNHYDNSDRLDTVTEKDWRDALDQLTAYLTWRLRGKTATGAHSEKALGMPAFYYPNYSDKPKNPHQNEVTTPTTDSTV